MNKCALYTYFNDNYFECGSNMIFSFVKKNKWFSDRNYPIIILQDDKFCVLCEKNTALLNKIYKNIIYHKVNMSEYEKIFKTYKYVDGVYDATINGIDRQDGAISAFYKYEIFKKNEYNRKVLLDADIIIMGDIKPLFETKTYFTCCLHGHTKEITKRTDDTQYFNGGVYAINEDVEHDTTFDDIMDFSNNIDVSTLKTHKSAICHGIAVDQDYLNIYFNGKDVDLYPSSKFNCLVSDGVSDAVIIHYYGPFNKPWEKAGQNITRNRLGFLYYYEVSYWKNRFLSEH